MITSIIWPNIKKKINKINLTYLQQYPQFLINSLLFNYWMAFFGSLFLVFALINIEKLYGFLDWTSINAISNSWILNIFNYSYLSNVVYWIPLYFGFMVKLGYLPFYIWKPEVYKGLSYYTVFFFMTLYFFVLVIIYIYIFFSQLKGLNFIWFNYNYLLTTMTAGIIITAIFDLTTMKPFLAYGTLIHFSFIVIALSLC